MHKIFYLIFLCATLSAGKAVAQEILPGITVKNFNGKIIVSWRNEYPLEVKTINIQRSFDSAKNFSTIGSVLNPQNIENGFVDETPPYNKMYYRVFVSFDAGAYVFSESVRPVKESLPPLPLITIETKQPSNDASFITPVRPTEKPGAVHNDKALKNGQFKNEHSEITSKEIPVTYPSRRIYTARDNNVVVSLPNADTKKYSVKFFDEETRPLFELNKLKDDYLIIEKVNFLRSGWFYFEVYENNKLIEKNKFYIPKDGKPQ